MKAAAHEAGAAEAGPAMAATCVGPTLLSGEWVAGLVFAVLLSVFVGWMISTISTTPCKVNDS